MARLIPDVALAVCTIWAEARGESDAGKLGVAEVIRNRTARCYQSDGTIAGTVLRPAQFSCWAGHDPNRIPAVQIDDVDPVVTACIAAYSNAQDGTNTVDGATIYFNPETADQAFVAHVRNTCVRTATIGRHEFYRERAWPA